MRAVVPLAALVVLAVAIVARQPSAAPLFGFTAQSSVAQRSLERRFLTQPDPSRLRDSHRTLTAQPHPAGSQRNRELADWTAHQFRAAGMDDVQIVRHDVLLPHVRDVAIEMTGGWRATMREQPVDRDADTGADPAVTGIPYYAFSASGDVNAPAIFAGSGTPADYDWLAARGVDVRGRVAIVRLSRPYSYRGFKAMTAEARGVAAILMVADGSAEPGAANPRPYPLGPWAPGSRIERGSIAYDFIAPGDPLTPGWPSTAGARRLAAADAALPTIVSAPLSLDDVRPLLAEMNGPDAPPGWCGSITAGCRVGPGGRNVRVRVQSSNDIRPIWTVTGTFTGAGPGVVIVGNHRDAWIYGGVDPSSGSAALVELATSLGALVRGGWRPRRSLLFASWDAEELSLTSSTEWGEERAAWLQANAIAYINVDSAASGQRLVANASPSLTRAIAGAAEAVRDPLTRLSLAAVTRERNAATRGLDGGIRSTDVVRNRLGGGSDYVVFVDHLGVPSADLSFQGPYGVYHSIYDTHEYVARFADPGFRYQTAMVQLWGVAALRLAQADSIPIDPSATATAIAEYVAELRRRVSSAPSSARVARLNAIDRLDVPLDLLARSASVLEGARESALANRDHAALAAINERLLSFERAFLDDAGLPGRPWYRHLVHAPKFSYEPEVLPGLSEAIDAGDDALFATELQRLEAALGRAVAHIDGAWSAARVARPGGVPASPTAGSR